MSRILALRTLSPALLDYTALTFMPLNIQGFKEGSCQFLKHWSVLQLALYGGVGRPSALPKLSSVFQLQRHKTLHFGGNFMKIGPKLKKLSVFKGQKHFSRTLQFRSSENKDYEINPVFINRNPRNLEKLGLAPKRKGWKFQAPRRDYYHKLILEVSQHHTTARLEHWTGTAVLEASTREWSLRKHLYSYIDVCAAENVGKMVARRCLEAGITNVFYDPGPNVEKSEKIQAFIKSLENGNLVLQEPKEVMHEDLPGIDYDNPARYNPKRQWTDDIQPV